jgi:uncharacterized protein YgiM (DUF1202 family)
MFRLLSLLCGSLFLVLLIGGEDRGQMRFGLMERYAPPEAAPLVVAAALVTPAPEIVLAAYPTAAAPEPVALPAAAVAVAEPVAVTTPPVEAAPALDVRFVNSNAINVRQGPSTNDPVIGRLTRNEAVTVVADKGDGWVLVRIEGDGVEGYVAGRLLTTRTP